MDSNNFEQNQQMPNQQPQQPQQPYYPQQPLEAPMTVGDWMLTILLTLIPCVNIIMLFVWAFGGSAQQSKSNWAKAQLIWVAISIGLTILLYVVIGASVFSMLRHAYY